MAILTPYLNFRGSAREALEFYHRVIGGDLVVSSFGDFQASEDPEEVDLIMHGQLTGPGGLVLMASDTPKRMEYSQGINDFSVSLSGSGDEDREQLTRIFEGLAEGGTIAEPLVTAPWGDTFGMLTDRFGVSWLVNIAGAAQA